MAHRAPTVATAVLADGCIGGRRAAREDRPAMGWFDVVITTPAAPAVGIPIIRSTRVEG